MVRTKEEVLKNLNDEYYPKPESSRKSWQKATDLGELDNKTLYKSDGSERAAPTPRKFWGQPHDSVIRGFEAANLSQMTILPSSSESSSSAASLIGNEKPLEKTLLKLATLKSGTKNVVLGMTMGQFDPKNTKMLRTCSEPDLTALPIEPLPIKPDNATQRLIKSLEDIKPELDIDVS